MKRICFVFIGFILLLSGCDLALEEEYWNVIEPPATDDVTIVLPQVGDTIYTFSKSLLQFNVEGVSGELLWMKVYLGNKVITEVSPYNQAFELDVRNFDTGYYPLELVLFTTGGTGSLADVMDMEHLSIRRKWTVYVDKSRPEKVAFKEIYPDSGTLKLNWEPYPAKNFQAYEIKKYCYNPTYQTYNHCNTFIVSRQSETLICDSTFVGGTAMYKLRVLGSDQYSEYSEKEFSYELDPELNWRWLAENELEVRWNKNPFYQNLKYYGLKRYYSAADVPHLSLADTIHYRSFGFGGTDGVSLEVISKSEKDRFDKRFNDWFDHRFRKEVYRGEKVHPALTVLRTAVYNRAHDLYYVVSNSWKADTLLTFNGKTHQPDKKLVLDQSSGSSYFSISPNGQWAYATYQDKILQIDPVSLTVLQTYTFSELNGARASSSDYARSLQIADNNRLLLRLNTGALVVDMNTLTVLYGTIDWVSAMAPDGSQLYIKGFAYRWNGATYALADQLFATEGLESVAQYAADSLVLIYKDVFKIIDDRSGAELKSIPIMNEWNSSTYVNYDPVSRQLGQYFRLNSNWDNTDFVTHNITTDERRTITITNTNTSYFTLLNNKLLCSNGYLLSLD